MTALEIAFALLATVGIFYSARNLIDAIRDRQAIVEEHVENGRRAIAAIGVRVEAARLVILLILLIRVLLSLPVTAGLIVVALLVVFQSWQNARLRQYLREHAPDPSAVRPDP